MLYLDALPFMRLEIVGNSALTHEQKLDNQQNCLTSRFSLVIYIVVLPKGPNWALKISCGSPLLRPAPSMCTWPNSCWHSGLQQRSISAEISCKNGQECGQVGSSDLKYQTDLGLSPVSIVVHPRQRKLQLCSLGFDSLCLKGKPLHEGRRPAAINVVPHKE